MAPSLGYWKIRGLAQPIRLLLGYTNTDFEDVIYECGDAPEYNRDCWLTVKDKLGLDFPNLPYYIDGDLKITESNAILRYIGRKNGMDGDSEVEKVRVDMAEHIIMNVRNQFVRQCYGPNFETNLQSFKPAAVERFRAIATFLGDRKFIAGEKLTYPDFHLYEMLDHHLALDSNILDGLDSLKAYKKRFEDTPEIAAFMRSDKCFKGPINNKMAAFK